MKLLKNKIGLMLLVALSACSLSAAGEEVTSDATAFPADFFAGAEPETPAQVAARTGMEFEDGKLVRTMATDLFPMLDNDLIKTYEALELDAIRKQNIAYLTQEIKRFGAQVGVAGIGLFLLYKTFLAPRTDIITMHLAAPEKGGTPLTQEQFAQGMKELANAVNEHAELQRGKTFFKRVENGVVNGFGMAIQMGLLGALSWGATYAFSSSPKSPLARHFIDTFNNLVGSVETSAMEYSNLVGTVAHDKGQTDEVFTSVLSRSHGQFMGALEQHFGFLLALNQYFVKQQEMLTASLEAAKAKPVKDEVTLAEQRRALAVAKRITDIIDSTLQLCHPLANSFTGALEKATTRIKSFNTVMNYLARLCSSDQEQTGLLLLQARQLDTALHDFYGIAKPKAPNAGAIPAELMALMGGAGR